MHRGFAKLYRKFLEWEWYDNIPCKVLYIHCLLKANHKEKKYRGVIVERGSFLTSYAELAEETGLTVKQVRVAQQKLEPDYLASKRTNKGQTICVVDFNTYNDCADIEGKQEGKQRASRGQAEGKQRATTKNDKNNKNEKNDKNYNFCTEREQSLFDSMQEHWGDRLSEISKSTVERLIANLSAENYPGVNIPHELKMAAVWEDSNPTKRKTARGLPRFLTGWMDRAQNRPSRGQYNTNRSTKKTSYDEEMQLLRRMESEIDEEGSNQDHATDESGVSGKVFIIGRKG